MNLKSILFSAVAMAVAFAPAFAATPKVIAHRGYWKTDGSAQNSIRALVKADSVGCYASEFDVWMSKDGEIMVNHDPSFNGVVLETSWAKKIHDQKLANGENIPYLKDYLAEAQKHPNMRLVLELKHHDSNENEREAIRRILKLVKKYGLEDRVDYITFSKYGFDNFIKQAPKGTEVYYLSGDYIPEQVKFKGGAGIDYSIKVLRKHPEWIKECQNKGMKVNVWTVDKPEDMKWCIEQGVDFITTNQPEQLMQMLQGK